MLALHFISGTHLHDRVIRLVERAHDPSSDATHVVLLSHWRGIEAAWPRVRYWVPSAGNVRAWQVPVSASSLQEGRVWDAAVARVGESYDLPGLLWAGWYSLTGRPDKFFTQDKARVHCASLVVECLRAGGIDWFPTIPASNITPSMLASAAMDRQNHNPLAQPTRLWYSMAATNQAFTSI